MEKYEEQWGRVNRYFQGFTKLNAGMPHTMAGDNYLDDVYAFFQNCYHLKDWLKKDAAFTKHFRF